MSNAGFIENVTVSFKKHHDQKIVGEDFVQNSAGDQGQVAFAAQDLDPDVARLVEALALKNSSGLDDVFQDLVGVQANGTAFPADRAYNEKLLYQQLFFHGYVPNRAPSV